MKNNAEPTALEVTVGEKFITAIAEPSYRDAIADEILRTAIYQGREGSVTTAEDRDSYDYLNCQNAADAIIATMQSKLSSLLQLSQVL